MTQPLFILCPGRSFSSVVCAAIGQHPQMFGLPEVNLFSVETVERLIETDIPFFGIPGVLTGLRRTVAELLFNEQTEDSVNRAIAWIEARSKLSGVEMFEALRELAGDRELVDKSPTNSGRKALHRLFAAYPDAYYLHLSRHPRATCRSRITAHQNRKPLDPNALERLWYNRHLELVQFGRTVPAGRFMFLKGEIFFEHPTRVLRQICHWLDISDDDAAIAAMMRPEQSPFATLGPDNAKFGNNPGFIEKPALRVGKIKDENLHDPLEWFEGQTVYFGKETRELAMMLGYEDEAGTDSVYNDIF
jgi:Sulfotransferase family